MVGLVLVSHSSKVAEGVLHLVRMMAEDVPCVPAGGLEDGSYGTSFDKIKDAVIQADTGDGALIIMDMGSSVMTAEMVVDDLPEGVRALLADCPMVEGAVAASVAAEGGDSLEAVKEEAESAWEARKC